MIDPRALRTFLYVCREKSISGAARKLNISQPAISVTISNLEGLLGAKLFERSRSGILLTPEGHALQHKAEALEDLLLSAETEVEHAKVGVSGPLRIGGTPGALVSIIPMAVNRLSEEHGRFALRVVERADNSLIDMLRKGEIEIAVSTTGIGDLPDDIEEQSFVTDPFNLLVGKANDHLPAELSLKETGDMKWVLPEAQGAFARQVEALFMEANMPTPLNAVRCDSLLTTKAIVRSGGYVTILPSRVAASELSMGLLRAIKIKGAHIERQVGIRTLAGGKHSELAKQFINVIDKIYT